MTSVSQALQQRISVRAFLDKPVPEALLREVLEAARWSPSGGNLQPWRVIAVAGKERDAIIDLARNGQWASQGGAEDGGYAIYPPSLWEPYRSRRFAIGESMYALLGIEREDKQGRLANFERNYEFFGAPVGLFFVIDRRMGHGQWAHMGMFMQSLMLAATERGLATCAQEAWGVYRGRLHKHFGLGASELLYCGMALGYADPNAPVNRLRSERASVDEIATLRGF